MPIWSDFFKLFTYEAENDPLSAKKDPRNFGTAGITQPEAMSSDYSASGGGLSTQSSFRQTYDMIDTTSLANRAMRYKEYERLRNVPEIEMTMTLFSDEACVAGDTLVATPFGFISIKDLAEKKSDERFLVYCYDFRKKDYTLGWAYAPRLVKTAPTITVVLDNGKSFTATDDHRVLLRDGHWIETGRLEIGDELMPFYRIPAKTHLSKQKQNQFPRLYSFNRGWIHERQFLDDWKTSKTEPIYEKVNKAVRLIGAGIGCRQIAKQMGHDWKSIEDWFQRAGFSHREIKSLYKNEDRRRIVDIYESPSQPVYDISVDQHQCFATDSVILHNCQKDEKGNIFKIITKNDEVREELEFLLLNRKMLNLNRNGWIWFKNLCIFGDWFVEIVINPDNPKEGVYRAEALPVEQMYRIQTINNKIVEFQQSKEGPDYQAIASGNVVDQNDMELNKTTAIRFAPNQIVHFRLGDDKKTFFPYGQSLIEPARAPAHTLRLMEDAMVVYRLCLVGNTRIRTKNGYKYIKDLTIKDNVYSFDESGKTIETNITNFVNNGVQDVYKIKSKHVEITGTATHPILVKRQGIVQYVDIKDLIPKKDMIINVSKYEENAVQIPTIFGEKWAKLNVAQRTWFRNCNYENKMELLRSCSCDPDRGKQFLYSEGKALPYDQAVEICEKFEIDPDQLIILNKGQQNQERINLPKIVDEDFARLFGFLLGDGSMSKNKCQLNFSAGMDEKQNLFYKNLLQKYFGKVRFEKEKRSKHKQLGKYVVDSAIACKVFTNLGYIHGAKNKRIPAWVFNSPMNIRKAFVQGICNADGCERKTKKGTWFSTIELCNQKLIEDIKEVWSSIGLCSGIIKKRERKNGHYIEKDRRMPPTISYQITISESQLPKYEKILSVEYAGKEEVFDITVDNELHNFIANGIPVHNTRAPERRIFYVDCGQLPPFKADAFMERMKDNFRKRKIANNRGGTGANGVEERWQPPAQDEDYWVPIRPNSNTRIETLPGAENLGEIDDAVYFRNKLLTALNMPKNYFNNEDVAATKLTVSANDSRFARMIERLQSSFEDGVLELAERHLHLRGFPEESFQDLKIKMTPPSDWREQSKAEVVSQRYANAGTLKSSQLYSDYDIYTDIFKFNEEEAEEKLARLKIQKLEDLKLQVLAQNPQLLGIGIPGQEQQQGQEIGSEPGGPAGNIEPGTNMGNPDMTGGAPQEMEGLPAPTPETSAKESPSVKTGSSQEANLPEPSEDEIKKYDLEIQDYEAEQDKESIDFSVGD